MILLFTDYGSDGPYIGQVEAVFHLQAPRARVIRLLSDSPRNNPMAAAYMLSGLAAEVPPGTIFFSVVDPGVGGDKDEPVIMKLDNRWFVGPDNGLFDIVARRAKEIECWKITWRPDVLLRSFHGRDLYAPVCAMLFNRHTPPGEKIEWKDRHGWPDDLYEIIYLDHFGNAMTGIRTGRLHADTVLDVSGQKIVQAETFSDVLPGSAFWYDNSIGLVELAVNLGSAAECLGIGVGSKLRISN